MQEYQKNTSDRIKVEVKVMNPATPLCCPLPNMSLWNMHPRVYLATDADNRATCPYCSTSYYLAADE